MEAILQAKEISKTYHTGSVDVPALKQCSLEFGKGEFTAIIGKSGSGKSTLLRILGSMDTPDTGSILIKGEDITHMKDKKLSGFRRRNIGFIYQDYSLFPEFTSYENIVMPILLCITKISTFLILCDLAVCLATLYVSFSLVFALMRYLQGKVFLIRFYSPTTLSSSRAEFRLPSRLACA